MHSTSQNPHSFVASVFISLTLRIWEIVLKLKMGNFTLHFQDVA